MYSTITIADVVLKQILVINKFLRFSEILCIYYLTTYIYQKK